SAAAGMSGVGNGQFVLDIPLPFSKTHLSTLAGKGSLDASAVVAGAFAADSASAQLSLRDGVLRIDPIAFHKADRDMNGQGGRAGQAVISIETQTADLLKPTVKLSAQNWPVRMGGEEGAGGGVAVVSADASLAVNASPHTPFTVRGPLTARVRFATTRSAIGEFSTEGQIEGRIAVFEKITLSGAGGVGGTGHGHATIDLDDPNRTTALLEWSDLDGARLGELVPALAGLSGNYSGEL